jgi:hypothetical protein
MKLPVLLALLCLAIAGCQNGSQTGQTQFTQKTHRTYNPQTESFEQSPPFGKQSNKTTD